MATLDKLPSGRFRVRYSIRASEKRRTRTFPTEAEALAFKAAIERTDLTPPHASALGFSESKINSLVPRYDDFVLNWFKNHAPVVKPSSAHRYGKTLNGLILPHFALLPVDQITAPVIRGWQTQLLNEGYSPYTIRLARTVLNMTLNAAAVDGVIPVNPLKNAPVKQPRIPKTRVRILTEPEIRLLTESMDDRYRALVLLGAYGGLRIGELFALQISNVDLETGEVHVERTLSVDLAGRPVIGSAKTDQSVRTVTVPKLVVRAIEHHLRQDYTALNGTLFSGPRKRLPLRVAAFRQHPWRRAIEESGLAGVTPHDLRHTAVSLWIRAGASPKLVAARAGHSSVKFVFDTYGHLFDDEDADLAAKLGLGWD